MKGSIAAINQEAREHGMSYGKYMLLLAAQKAPAAGTEEKTTAKPKRSTPPGARLAVRQWKTGVNRPGWKSQRKISRVYGLSMEEIFRLLEEAEG